MTRTSPIRLRASIAALVALLAPGLVSHAFAQIDRGPGRVVRLSCAVGQVQVSYAGADWFQASAPLDLQQGDSIATAVGAAEVEFENGAIAYLAENSTLEITTLAFGQGRITGLTLVAGAATVYANPASTDEFTVAAPGLEVAAFSSAEFRVDANSDQPSVQVLRGSVSVNSGRSAILLDKGRRVTVRQGVPGSFDFARLPQPDAFDRWVSIRSSGSHSGLETDAYPNSPGDADGLFLLPYGQVSTVNGPVVYGAGYGSAYGPIYGPVYGTGRGRCVALSGRRLNSAAGSGGIVFDCATRTFINGIDNDLSAGSAVSPAPRTSRPPGSSAVLNDSESIRVFPRPGTQLPNQIPLREHASPLRPRRNAFAPVTRQAPARPVQRPGQAPRRAQMQPQTRQMGSWRAVSPQQNSGAALNPRSTPRPNPRMNASRPPASPSRAGPAAGSRASSTGGTRGSWGAGR